MNEFSVSMNVMAAGIGVLIAAYVILGVMLVLGAFALMRLAVLAKRTRALENKSQKDCASCDELKKKDQEIAALQQKIKELEAKPQPQVIVPVETRTLSESLAAASAEGAKGVISKKSIIAYLSGKYGSEVELNGRANRTPNGKLLLSDNHFAFAPDGKRVCFTYVYETDEGQVVSLIKLDEPYVEAMLTDHSEVRRSAFPKNKAKDWYSVIADDTFTEQGYYAVLDHAIELIRGTAQESLPEGEVSLSESLAAAKETGAVGVVTKGSIIAHLAATFGDKVELNGRANRTPNGKLLMSDNHFAFAPDGKRVCFTYVYQDDDGKVIILLRTTAEHAKDIHTAHVATGVKSAFPKNKEKDWYSVVVDNSFTEAGVYAELDRAALNIIGKQEEVVATAVEPEEVSLSESLAAAKETGAVGVVTKQSIIDHLAATFGNKVELNGRANRTPNGKLLMSDNHFAFAPDGKRVCFTYVYQDDDGKVIILLRTTAEHAKDIHTAHVATGVKSAFPKNKEKDWYSVVVDGTFTEAGVYAELDRAALNIIGKQEEVVATVVEEPVAEPMEESAEVSLSESLAAAKETGAIGVVTKGSIIDHLAATFGDKVELNGRANRTPNGKLLMSDNHFAFDSDGKRVCFTYVYQDDDGKIIILLRTTMKHAQDIRSHHKLTGVRSAFPKNKERDWYSIVVDSSFTEKDVYALLDAAALNIINAHSEAPAPATPVAEGEEFSLKESLAAAKETGAVGICTKKSVIDALVLAYGDKVEINGRANRTPNGKLLLSDNHFALADGKRVCFTYVYEDEGKVVMLLRLSEKEAALIHAAHPATAVKSAFPKNKDKDWYSIVVDATFTEADVNKTLAASYAYALTK